MQRSFTYLGLGCFSFLVACGARTGLDIPNGGSSGSSQTSTGGGGSSSTGISTNVSNGGAGSTTSNVSTTESSTSTGPCLEGATQDCGSNVGQCKFGTQTCHDGVFGDCVGGVGPSEEICDGIDNNCNGEVDEGFNIGAPCKGTGTDECLDGVTTCTGCMKTGPDKVEICNGIDDNCNGIIDADCQVGDCKPSLLVTGSTPSNPACIDFPVMAGSSGTIEYPCAGGPVTADLGGIEFTGNVTNNQVTLDSFVVIPPTETPDGCTWQDHHHIEGNLPSGVVQYSYSEMVIAVNASGQCWDPCTESGTVKITWAAAPTN